jgi:uncharacterized protein (TIGR02246 family)
MPRAWINLRSLSRAAAACGLAAVLAACATALRPAVDTAADEQAIRDVMDRVETGFNEGALDDFIWVFADDAKILAQGQPDAVGIDAIRSLYEASLAAADLSTEITTEEVAVSGDLAYERGTYVVWVRDKATGALLDTIENRHVHILKRDANGAWRTWRFIASAAE